MTRPTPSAPPFADGPVNQTCKLCGASTSGALCGACVALPATALADTCARCGAPWYQHAAGKVCPAAARLVAAWRGLVAALPRSPRWRPPLTQAVVSAVLAGAMASQALRAAPAAPRHGANCLCPMCFGPPPTKVSTVADRKTQATQNKKKSK